MTPAVAATDVSVRYGSIDALREVSVAIEEGEIFALIGPNGAGKTTFVRAITGTCSPSQGTVRVFGATTDSVARDRLGLLPQAFAPSDRLTGREIIRFYAALYDDAQPVSEVLEAVGMGDRADRWYERLSGGEQRRICVGTALVNDPALLLLDEPTTGIDPAGRRDLRGLFRRLRDEGRTILVTTHDMAEARQLADRVGLLDDGRLLAVDRPEALISAYGGYGRVIVEPRDPLSDTIEMGLDHPISRSGDELIVEEVASTQLADVVRSLDEHGITYRRLSWQEPSLEDVYFALTEGDR